MAVATYVQAGDSIDYTPSSAVSAGDVVIQGDLVGVAKLDIGASELGALALEGVFDFPKAGGTDAMSAGTVAYWDEAEGQAGPDDETSANPRLGLVVAEATAAATTVRVKINR